MMAVSSTPVPMDVSNKPKLRFSIDVLMGKDSEKRSPPSSPSPDYRRSKMSQEEPVAHPKIPTPQVPIYRRDSIVIPVPTFPSGTPVSSLNAATTVTSSRNRPAVGLMSSTPASSMYPRSALTHCNIQQHNGPLEPIPAMFLHGDAFSSFPLLLARQRFLPHGFGPGPDIPGYLLHPYRKPKRIRTAFSANQLMKLEGAFDKNHYVTGNERKQLADSLGLSETQVKVWFQNRRTKQKRQVLEEKERSGRSGHNSLTTTPESFNREMSSHSPSMRSPSPSADVNITEDEDDDKLSSNNESYDEQTS